MGIISQPDWRSADAFKALGKPNPLFGIAAGNMDSMINHSTADRKRRNDDAYTAGDVAGKRPDRAVTVYSQRAREAHRDVSLVIGGIEASLRRMAHYDYWSDNVRRSVLVHCKADILLYGNAERAIVDLAHGLTNGKEISDLRHLRGTAFLVSEPLPGYRVIDSTSVDEPGKVEPMLNPYEGMESEVCDSESEAAVEAAIQEAQPISGIASSRPDRDVIRLTSVETVKNDPVLYAHAARIMHKETISHNALALIQAHGDREVWFNPPPIPLSTPELDWVFEQSYQRRPHPTYGDAKIPALEMIQHSVNVMRGCFGGCTFCSITEHEGRIIQNRSEESIIREIEKIRDTSANFTGVISDLGDPTANMWRLAYQSEEIEAKCRKLSCVFPGLCKNLNTDQTPLIHL